MSLPSTQITLVHTDDAAPDAPKYRISDKVGHDTALATVTADTGRPLLVPGVGLRPGAGLKPTDAAFDIGNALVGDLLPGMSSFVGAVVMTTGNTPTAQHVAALGVVCGITRCGSEGARPLRAYSKRGHTLTLQGTIKWAEIQGADRDVTVNVFTLVEPEGWV